MHGGKQSGEMNYHLKSLLLPWNFMAQAFIWKMSIKKTPVAYWANDLLVQHAESYSYQWDPDILKLFANLDIVCNSWYS